eukprot:4714535-Alexandrium_andersonii.AAC.1
MGMLAQLGQLLAGTADAPAAQVPAQQAPLPATVPPALTQPPARYPVSYTHLRAHETSAHL